MPPWRGPSGSTARRTRSRSVDGEGASAVKLVVYDDYRVGVMQDDGLHDVTAAIPGWDPTWPQTFMLRTIANFATLRPAIERAAANSPPRALNDVRLLPSVPCPNKIVAAP